MFDAGFSCCLLTAILRRDVLMVVKDGLSHAIADFLDQVLKVKRIQRISKVLKAGAVLEKVSKVAGILAAEQPASCPVLWGLIQEIAGGTSEETRKEIFEREQPPPPPQDQELLSKNKNSSCLKPK